MPVNVYLLIIPAGDIANLGRGDRTMDMRNALKGDVTEPGHMHWIEVKSYSIKTQGGPQSKDVPQIDGPGDVTLTRDSIDGISPLLMRWSGTGGAPVKRPVVAIIDLVKGDKDKLELVLEILMQDVVVTRYVTSANGGSDRGESFTLNSGKITSTYVRWSGDPVSTLSD